MKFRRINEDLEETTQVSGVSIGHIDSDLRNADWTKRSWDNLPQYKSKEFMEYLKLQGITIEHFKTLPVYKSAVRKGLIKDDKWVGGSN
ncbi:hypothetical protein HSE3_gp022 [Bacillus phage vB_BceM-HSE3]|nr:hypothetical protein HSE3_gp022 [Bacillus phage vB_BceM-HSE3]